MPRIGHFEQAYDDPEAAAKFYTEVFNWGFKAWEDGEQPYWLVTTGSDSEQPGINGGFMKKSPNMPTVVNTIIVDDIDNYTKKVEQAGGKSMTPKMDIPGMGHLAYFVDPGGVGFGLFQADMSAQT
jgi:predicted enzyme related to lactoylglutathione lyase